eukprot:m.56908 g.56908  ORF g.56908 m.56908 type:complete len:301 (+) comp11067_c0_seq3:176-1078(+)
MNNRDEQEVKEPLLGNASDDETASRDGNDIELVEITTNNNTDGGTDNIVDQQPSEIVFEELPPAYTNEVWKDSRALGEDINISIENRRSSYEDPFAGNTEGPRTVRIRRTSHGFGFTIGGSRPCCAKTVSEVAKEAGLKQHDHILEINGCDVTESSIAEVSSQIQLAEEYLVMVVVPGLPESNPLDERQLSLTDRLLLEGTDASGFEIDPTQRPPSNMLAAAVSVICCPIVGCAAVWHAKQVSQAWALGHFSRARLHSIMSKKLAGSAVFYGIVILMMWLFVSSSQDKSFGEHPRPGRHA